MVLGQLQRVADDVAQVVEVQRLRNEIECAELQGLHGRLDVAVRGYHRDRHAGRVGLHPFDQFEAVAVGQAHVGQADIEFAVFERLPRACHVFGDDRLHVHPAQRQREQLPDVGFIVDHECHGFLHCVPVVPCRLIDQSPTASQRFGSANTIRKILPPPSRGLKVSVARLSSHSSREIYKPSPVPPLLAV